MLSAAPPESPEELIRRGNAAAARGDLVAAGQLYAAAAERADDPGLVAFNRAAVLFHTGDVRDAELHYLRALDDRAAPPGRRARAMYNRGVCLLKRGGEVGVYRAAIDCFERCLDLGPADDTLRADARHNLELAKLLWNEARAKAGRKPTPNEPPPDERPEQRPPPRSPDAGAEGGTDPGQRSDGPDPRGGRDSRGGPNGPEPRPANSKSPGAGSLPVLEDDGRPQPLTPEDTRAYLDRIAVRLEKDRKGTARMLLGPDRPGVKDW